MDATSFFICLSVIALSLTAAIILSTWQALIPAIAVLTYGVLR